MTFAAGEEQTYRCSGGRSKTRKGAVVLRLSRPYDAVDHTSLDESLPRVRSGAAPTTPAPPGAETGCNQWQTAQSWPQSDRLHVAMLAECSVQPVAAFPE